MAWSERVRAIRTVTVGRKYAGPDPAQILATGVDGATGEPLHTQLSQREFPTFCTLATGENVVKLADELLTSMKIVSVSCACTLATMNPGSNADITDDEIYSGLTQ